MPKPVPRDRHHLYELSVQCPPADAQFFDRIYHAHAGRLPLSLREDFCGTAALAAEWVRRRDGATALGVDLHHPTLEWGKRRNLAPLGEKASRVRLIEADVRSVTRPQVDLLVALNFSYFVFHTRRELLEYFRVARKSVKKDGLFVCDIFGGWESQALVTETRRKPGFTYVWQQASFDPITHRTRFYIHFRFREGGEMKRAFTYDWRLWTVPEVREILHEAGFGSVEVYWEGTDRKTRKGNGVFRRTERTEACPGWIAYLVARA
jgi:SAM-dependent methyltransferase